MNDRNRTGQAAAEPCLQTEGAEAEGLLPENTDAEREDSILTPEQIKESYIATMNDLVRDATARNGIDVLIDVVAWKIAAIATSYGPRATGEVIRVIGLWIEHLAHIEEARREAAAAIEAGHAPN